MFQYQQYKIHHNFFFFLQFISTANWGKNMKLPIFVHIRVAVKKIFVFDLNYFCIDFLVLIFWQIFFLMFFWRTLDYWVCLLKVYYFFLCWKLNNKVGLIDISLDPKHCFGSQLVHFQLKKGLYFQLKETGRHSKLKSSLNKIRE